MNKLHIYKYDLHIHTALSPCGDDDMTPNNIVNMAMIKKRDIIAVTDHNTCGNARAVMEAAERIPGAPVTVPGMELTAAEDVHVLLYFPEINAAESFEREVVIPRHAFTMNREDIFGKQLYMDSSDSVTGIEERLLVSATDISIDELPGLIEDYGAVIVPAHIDKEANGLLAMLGTMPEKAGFHAVEIFDHEKEKSLIKAHSLGGIPVLKNSDAHYLWDIIEETDGIDSVFSTSCIIDSARDFISMIKSHEMFSQRGIS